MPSRRRFRAPVLCVAALLSTFTANAQLSDLVRRLLIGDTLAPPDHDTAYIISHRNKVTLSAVTSDRYASLEITDTAKRAVTWATNNATQYGLAIDYRWLSVEATFSVPALVPADPRLGATASKGVGLGFTGRRLWFRGFWNTSSGFHAEDPGALVANWTADQPWPYRRDISVETWMGSLNYALSRKRRFSQIAALTQVERQQRSAGTWVAGAAFWLTRLNADSTLVPTTGERAFTPDAHIAKARRTLAGFTIGYTHTFALWRKGFLHAALLTGAASSTQVRSVEGRTGELTEPGISSISELRIGAGYNGDRWYAGLTSVFFINADNDEERVSLGSTYNTVRLAAGLRFGRPNIKGIQRFGL